jgi:hypothetical protein
VRRAAQRGVLRPGRGRLLAGRPVNVAVSREA